MIFPLSSHVSSLYSAACQAAEEYASSLNTDDLVGIVLLGAVVRGYYDEDSDIDISVFRKEYSPKISSDTRNYKGFHLHEFIVDYNSERNVHWEKGKRWAYSQCRIFWERDGLITNLLADKVPLGADEKKWLVMSGMALSEWYCNGLVDLWIRRGDILGAHFMFSEGLNHLFNALFALNNEITADFKWRVFCAQRLEVLPNGFVKGLEEILTVTSVGLEEVRRRQDAFMRVWGSLLPEAEAFLGMSYKEFKDKV